MSAIKICSFLGFIEFLEKKCKKDTILFRGQRQDKPLLPKLSRLNLKKGIYNSEKKMFAAFKRGSLPSLDFKPENDWDWLAIMQHYGLPTRLLDWTLNPLAALWFAVNKPPEKNQNGVVWVFTPQGRDHVSTHKTGNPFEGSRTKVFQPNHVTDRITSQAGWFTVHKYQKATKKFVALDKNADYKNSLKKLSIASDSFSDMRFHLDRCGINATSLFPGLDGLSKHIEWLNSFLSDEEPIQKNSKVTKKTTTKS
jgi:hypothetical protein